MLIVFLPNIGGFRNDDNRTGIFIEQEKWYRRPAKLGENRDKWASYPAMRTPLAEESTEKSTVV